MPEIIFIDALGGRRKIQARSGRSVMRAAAESGVPGILAECGGAMSCGTCQVYVQAPWLKRLPPPGPDESAILNLLLNAEPESRLSCQIRVEDDLEGLVIKTPSTQG